MNTILIALGILVYMTTNKVIENKNIRYTIIGFFAAIPFLMYQENNYRLDYTSFNDCGSDQWIYLKLKDLDRGYEIITMTTFCWLTMSCRYVGGISIVLFISIRSFINKFVRIPQNQTIRYDQRDPKNNAVIVSLYLLLLGSYGGQRLGKLADSVMTQEIVDPGSLYLNGGYIGRILPK